MQSELARRLNLSAEQYRAAADCDHDVLVSAGAGTGKTRVLAAHYLMLLLERGMRPAQVVAITFTNKAAAEMRERIRAALIDLTDIYPVAGELARELDWAPIQTIHSFCRDILRADPLAAGIDPGFVMLEEGEAALSLAEACDKALAAMLCLEPPAADLSELLRVFGRRRLLGLAARIHQELARWGLQPEQAAVERHTKEALRAAVDAFGAWWTSLAAVPVPADLAPGTKDALIELAAMNPDKDETLAQLAAGLESPLLDELTAILGRLRAGDFKQAAADGREIIVRVKRSLAADRSARIGPAFLTLVGMAGDFYAAAKRERGALDFADLELKTVDLLAREAAQRAVQERHPILLVDEFQDTNPLQWRIIQALRQGARGCRLFVVGDVKQSIYRFRGADVRVMEGLRRELTQKGKVHALQENYRCQPAVAALVNQVCGRLFDAETPYEPLLAQRDGVGDEPAVEAAFIAGDKIDRAAEADWIAARLAEALNTGLEISDPETGTRRPLRLNDIALLLRAATNVGFYEKALRQKGLPFRVSAGGAFYLRDEIRDLVQLLAAVEDAGDGTALAATLRSPLFGVSDAGLLRAAGDEGLARGFQRADFTAPEFGADGPRLRHARTLLGRLRAERHLLGLAQILAAAIEATDYWALQAGFFDYRQRLANVEKLLREAGRFDASGRGEVGDFLAYLEAAAALQVRESEAGAAGGDEAIQILTVHRAKGLEFPLVVLADLARGVGGRYPEVLLAEDGRLGFRFGPRESGAAAPNWTNIADVEAVQEEAEAKRLLYVALTRARDRLVLVGSGRGQGANWLNWLQDSLGMAAGDPQAGLAGVAIKIHRPAAAEPAAEFLPAPLFQPEAPAEAVATPAVEIAATGEDLLRNEPWIDLTVSEALVFRACPRRFYLRHVLKIPEFAAGVETGVEFGADLGIEPGTGGPALGSLVHRIAARMALAGEETAPDFPADTAPDLARLIENYRRSKSYTALAGAAEVWSEYEAAMAGERGSLTGVMDLVWLDADDALHLADLKTNRLERPGGGLLAEHQYQLQLYALMLKGIFGRPAGAARLEYLWPGRGVEVPVDAETLDRVQAELDDTIRFIAANQEPAAYAARTGAACRWCGFAATCPAYAATGGQGGQADDPS